VDAAALLEAIDKENIPHGQNVNPDGKAHTMSKRDRLSSMETQVDAAALLEAIDKENISHGQTINSDGKAHAVSKRDRLSSMETQVDAAGLLGATLLGEMAEENISHGQNVNSNWKAHAMSKQDRLSSMETQVDAAALLPKKSIRKPRWLHTMVKEDDVSSSASEASSSLSGSILDKGSLSEKKVSSSTSDSSSEASESSLSGSTRDKGSLSEKKVSSSTSEASSSRSGSISSSSKSQSQLLRGTSCELEVQSQTLSTMFLEEQERLEREEEQRRLLLDQQARDCDEKERKLQERRRLQEEARQGMLQEYHEKTRLQGLEEARQKKIQEMDDQKNVRAWMKTHGFNNVNNLSHMSKMGRKQHPEMERKKFKKVTPLHVAVRQNNLEMVKLLLAAGADARQFNSKNETPLKLAQKLDKNGSHAAVVQVLEMDQQVLAGLTCEWMSPEKNQMLNRSHSKLPFLPAASMEF